MMSYPFFIIDMDIRGQIIIFIHISLTWLILPIGDDSSKVNNYDLVGGIPTPLKNMNVNWDDDIPKIWKNKIHVPNSQPVKG